MTAESSAGVWLLAAAAPRVARVRTPEIDRLGQSPSSDGDCLGYPQKESPSASTSLSGIFFQTTGKQPVS